MPIKFPRVFTNRLASARNSLIGKNRSTEQREVSRSSSHQFGGICFWWEPGWYVLQVRKNTQNTILRWRRRASANQVCSLFANSDPCQMSIRYVFWRTSKSWNDGFRKHSILKFTIFFFAFLIRWNLYQSTGTRRAWNWLNRSFPHAETAIKPNHIRLLLAVKRRHTNGRKHKPLDSHWHFSQLKRHINKSSFDNNHKKLYSTT